MRGKELLRRGVEEGVGITPAYAGKSVYLVNQSQVEKDHPRVCGEKHLARSVLPPVVGSPPRMRGKDAQPSENGVYFGITPAYAGKSTVFDN